MEHDFVFLKVDFKLIHFLLCRNLDVKWQWIQERRYQQKYDVRINSVLFVILYLSDWVYFIFTYTLCTCYLACWHLPESTDWLIISFTRKCWANWFFWNLEAVRLAPMLYLTVTKLHTDIGKIYVWYVHSHVRWLCSKPNLDSAIIGSVCYMSTCFLKLTFSWTSKHN
jgi:hypothetical protein